MYLSDIKSYNHPTTIYNHPTAIYICPTAIYICPIASDRNDYFMDGTALKHTDFIAIVTV